MQVQRVTWRVYLSRAARSGGSLVGESRSAQNRDNRVNNLLSHRLFWMFNQIDDSYEYESEIIEGLGGKEWWRSTVHLAIICSCVEFSLILLCFPGIPCRQDSPSSLPPISAEDRHDLEQQTLECSWRTWTKLTHVWPNICRILPSKFATNRSPKTQGQPCVAQLVGFINIKRQSTIDPRYWWYIILRNFIRIKDYIWLYITGGISTGRNPSPANLCKLNDKIPVGFEHFPVSRRIWKAHSGLCLTIFDAQDQGDFSLSFCCFIANCGWLWK